MAVNTQNTNLSSTVKPTAQQWSAAKSGNWAQAGKLSKSQQNSWATKVVAKMTQSFKSKSINQVLWGDQKKK